MFCFFSEASPLLPLDSKSEGVAGVSLLLPAFSVFSFSGIERSAALFKPGFAIAIAKIKTNAVRLLFFIAFTFLNIFDDFCILNCQVDIALYHTQILYNKIYIL